MIVLKRFLIIAISTFILTINAFAGNDFTPVARVNDKVITHMDLENRIRMNFLFLNKKYDKNLDKNLKRDILNQLIEEKLKINNAEEAGLSISTEEINDRITKIEEQQKLPKGTMKSMMKSRDIDYSHYMDYVKANALWEMIARTKIQPTVKVTDYDVDEFVESRMKNLYRSKFNLSEIYLPANNDVAETEALANKLYTELQDGDDFASMANQFSRSFSRTQGGDIGWIDEYSMNQGIMAEIKNTTAGNVTRPIRLDNNDVTAFYIFKVKDIQIDKSLDSKDEQQIRDAIYRMKFSNAINTYLNDLYEEQVVEIY